MNALKSFCCRAFQTVLINAQKLINFPVPEVHEKLSDAGLILKRENKKHALIVSSRTVSKSEKFGELTASLESNGILYDITTDVTPDPTVECITKLYELFSAKGCDCIIAIGGGSVIDASKAAGIMAAYKGKSIARFRGMLKVGRKIPYFIAVPTTAGTGSEATVASVVTNEKNGDKYAVNDPKLIPRAAILDHELLKGLPQHVIGATGIDALSHAVEAYVGRAGNKFTDKYALEAIKLIDKSLLKFYENPLDDEARKNMLQASYFAGLSFTRAYVGYIHALAHAVGGIYHKPHGFCIGVFMPYVLEAYGSDAYKKLSVISDELNLAPVDEEVEKKASAVISYIRNLQISVGVPLNFDGLIEENRYNSLAAHACAEANPWYPVPKELDVKELESVIERANSRNN